MAVAKNEDELDEIRADDTAKKIKLEVPFERDILKFLRKINNEFAQQYIAEETVINADDFKAGLMGILLLNYDKITKKFKFNVRESFEEQVSDEINAKINNNINKFTKTTSNKQSNEIIKTINNDISQELEKTMNDFIEENKEIMAVSIANETRKNLNKKAKGKSFTIATTETQNMAEGTKETEQETLKDNNVVLDGVILATAINQVWTARFINTRPWHAEAHGQRKGALGFPGFYIVKGELLKRPGDTSSSPDNFINCYCSEVVTIF